jgi:hypothetical protein
MVVVVVVVVVFLCSGQKFAVNGCDVLHATYLGTARSICPA